MPINVGLTKVRAMADPNIRENSISLFTLTVEDAKPKPEGAAADAPREYYTSMPVEVVATNDWAKDVLRDVKKGDVLLLEARNGLAVSEKYKEIVELEEKDGDGNPLLAIAFMSQSDVEALSDDDLREMVKTQQIVKYHTLTAFNPRISKVEMMGSKPGEGGGKSSGGSGGRATSRRTSRRSNLPTDGDDE